MSDIPKSEDRHATCDNGPLWLGGVTPCLAGIVGWMLAETNYAPLALPTLLKIIASVLFQEAMKMIRLPSSLTSRYPFSITACFVCLFSSISATCFGVFIRFFCLHLCHEQVVLVIKILVRWELCVYGHAVYPTPRFVEVLSVSLTKCGDPQQGNAPILHIEKSLYE